jgi:hypothetical protein
MKLSQQVALAAQWLAHGGHAPDLMAFYETRSDWAKKKIEANCLDISSRHGWSFEDGLFWALELPYFMSSWAHWGFNVFRVTNSLCSMLMLTDIDRAEVSLPFPAFEIDLPEGVVRSIQEPGHFVTRLHVHRRANIGQAESLWIMVRYSNGHCRPFTRRWEALYAPTPEENGGTADGNAEANALLNIVRALGSFLSCRTEVLVDDNARSGMPRRDTAKVFTVGRTVKIPPEIRRLVTSPENSGPVWKLQNRYVVRGHYRWQPVGHRIPEGFEGPSNSKRIWIAPFWKGPEGAGA